MSHIIAFVLVIFVFVSGFMTIGVNICDNINRRIDKQNLNLAGRAVAEHAVYNSEGEIRINEKEYIMDIKKMLSNNVVGCIFVYENVVKGFDCNGICIANITVDSLTEGNIISAVNNILYELTEYSSPLESINIACSDDYIKNTLFNNLEGVTAFTVTGTERNGNYTYNVVGYCFFLHKNI